MSQIEGSIIILRFFENGVQYDDNGRPSFKKNFSVKFQRSYMLYYRVWLSEIIEFFIPFILLGKSYDHLHFHYYFFFRLKDSFFLIIHILSSQLPDYKKSYLSPQSSQRLSQNSSMENNENSLIVVIPTTLVNSTFLGSGPDGDTVLQNAGENFRPSNRPNVHPSHPHRAPAPRAPAPQGLRANPPP